ncbi:hypothetical protein mRhiFer1_009073 [Rhinolophus ferrumequinum]|uniref:Uncharacterized protein n=1 Tax=Rhinolophus ferrumequinum TaxID=59479 RepID=A0A7J7SXV4_RHIFE|nr:hypothetical protein mRhiFer1_009073 [Rhinolophus ferrumequinum]
MRDLRLLEVKEFSRGHRASKWPTVEVGLQSRIRFCHKGHCRFLSKLRYQSASVEVVKLNNYGVSLMSRIFEKYDRFMSAGPCLPRTYKFFGEIESGRNQPAFEGHLLCAQPCPSLHTHTHTHLPHLILTTALRDGPEICVLQMKSLRWWWSADGRIRF